MGLVGSSGLNVAEIPVVEDEANIGDGLMPEQRLRCDSRVARCWNGTWDTHCHCLFSSQRKVAKNLCNCKCNFPEFFEKI